MLILLLTVHSVKRKEEIPIQNQTFYKAGKSSHTLKKFDFNRVIKCRKKVRKLLKKISSSLSNYAFLRLLIAAANVGIYLKWKPKIFRIQITLLSTLFQTVPVFTSPFCLTVYPNLSRFSHDVL